MMQNNKNRNRRGRYQTRQQRRRAEERRILLFKIGITAAVLLVIAGVLVAVKPFSGKNSDPKKTETVMVDTAVEDNKEKEKAKEEKKSGADDMDSDTEVVDIKVKNTKMTAASSNHSAWIEDGKLQIAGDPYKNQDAAADWKDLVQVAISDEHIVALDKNGHVYATGSNAASQCTIDGTQEVIYIDAIADCSVAVMADGTVQVFGIMDPDRKQGLKEATDVQMVSVGVHHVIALHNDGKVSAYGKNEDGRCDVEKWKDIVSVSAGYEFSVGLTKKGKVVFAGNDAYDIRKCKKWSKIEKIEAGNSYVIGVDKKGAVVSAGRNRQGEGDVSGWEDIVSVAAGYDHTIALNKKGEFFAVGYNGMNQY